MHFLPPCVAGLHDSQCEALSEGEIEVYASLLYLSGDFKKYLLCDSPKKEGSMNTYQNFIKSTHECTNLARPFLNNLYFESLERG